VCVSVRYGGISLIYFVAANRSRTSVRTTIWWWNRSVSE